MTALRFCSIATAIGPPGKRWRNNAAQRSTASGVFLSLPISMRPAVAGTDATTCSLEAQSMAAKAAKTGSAGEAGNVDIRTSNPKRAGPVPSRRSYSGRRRRFQRIRFRTQTLPAAGRDVTQASASRHRNSWRRGARLRPVIANYAAEVIRARSSGVQMLGRSFNRSSCENYKTLFTGPKVSITKHFCWDLGVATQIPQEQNEPIIVVVGVKISEILHDLRVIGPQRRNLVHFVHEP